MSVFGTYYPFRHLAYNNSHSWQLVCKKGEKVEDTSKRPDRRVIKTKRAIRNAFAELLSLRDLDQITIKDVADMADISRKTFYNYYNGIYEVVDEIENEIAAVFDAELGSLDIRKAINDPYVIFVNLTAIINSDMDFYRHLLKMNGNVNLMTKIVGVLKLKIKTSFANQIDLEEEKIGIMVEYIITGMLAVYQSWFNSDRKQSIEEIAKLIGTLCFTGIAGVIGEN